VICHLKKDMGEYVMSSGMTGVDVLRGVQSLWNCQKSLK
jgi:hypothetical protein